MKVNVRLTLSLGNTLNFDRLRPRDSRGLLCRAGFVLLLASLVPLAHGQQQNGSRTSTSDLAAQNLRRVAGSVAEIKQILLRDDGMMVQLKRWVAKDAADHGQIVSDSDLTNESILDRLETDVQFRSIATILVQGYGYLIPKVNPDSPAGTEQALLMQERAKWLAQDQEEQRTQARQDQEKSLKRAAACESQWEQGCIAAPVQPSFTGVPERETQPAEPPTGFGPDEQNPSVLPAGPGGNATMRTQLAPDNADFTAGSSQLSIPNLDGSSQPFSGVNVSATGSLDSLAGETRAPFGGESMRGNSRFENGGDGLLAAYGGAMAQGLPRDGTTQEANRTDFRAPGSYATQGTSMSRQAASSNPHPQTSFFAQPLEMVRKTSPYNNIPSLYDMYVQAVPRPVAPRRFGSEVFENGSRDSQLIPMDLPVGPEYVVGPGDGLSVDLWGGVSQRLYRVVDREGRITLPEVGPILVSGKSLAAVQQTLQQTLRTQFRDVSADVSLSRLRTIRVYEVGDVTSPGAYDISSLSTPLNALFSAGGPTARGSLRILKHYRGTQLVETVDMYDLLLHGVKTDLQRLENGDTVQVPPIGPQVTVEGMVRRPAIYELKDEKNLASVLELAGGLLPTATLSHIEVQRIVAHEKQTMLNLDIPENEGDAAVTQKLESFEIHDGDRVRIFPIAPYNPDAIYVEGHVVRPGRYSYRADMRVTDVISSYKDMLPEPATRYAEIIRLNAPDFHPSVEGFDLAEALNNPAQAPLLHPMDTVRIFSRFDFENPPTVSVLGDVRKPGTYETSGQIHLTDAVHLAGGITPDAETGDAQVFRYLPDGKFKIFSVSLSQALGGDPIENIILQPRDRLLIHRNPDAVDPASVYIQGEVARPGRFPLTANMHVADLIRIAGGLQPSADTQTADLTKYQWSDKSQSKLNGQQEVVSLSAALAGDPKSNITMQNGDVLTIRQLPGWNELGASITLKGEVIHPGTYGIRPGERLSSILERAGGFQPDAYPYGAVLQREQVRELEAKSQAEIITRVRDAQTSLELLPENDSKQKEAKALALQQAQASLDQLSASTVLGRLTIRISSRLDHWRNTPADIEVRAGDTLTVPKRPSFVMVTGEVFNPTAVSYRPGKNARWYLSQSGGPGPLGNKKGIFVIRADGSVIASSSGLLSGDSLATALEPGDTVVVPERAIAGGIQWQSALLTAQTAASIASAVIIAVHY